MWYIAVICGALGIGQVIWPRAGWWVANFWRFEGPAEPSPFSLTMYRLEGFILVGLAVFFGSQA